MFFLFRFLRERIKKKSLEKLKRYYNLEDLLLYSLEANFFGQKSYGFRQIRGNGALALLHEKIHFFLLLPDREIIIPISKIISVNLKKSFLGKTVFKPLLHVEFLNENGDRDEVAWLLKNPDLWKVEIDNLRKNV